MILTKTMIETEKIKFNLSPKQGLAFKALENEPPRTELLFGGAKGGGKSVFGCIWMYYRAWKIIKDFNLVPRKYPLVVGFMGRKQSVDFVGTTLETWKQMIPSSLYDIKEQKKLIVIEDTVAIKFGGFDDSDMVKKFNSAEYGIYFVDQAEECTEEDIGLLRGTHRLTIDGKPYDFKGLLTANPAICWLKSAFITNPQPRTKFIQSLPSDNPYLPDGYIATLHKAFGFRPELLRAYLDGSWDDLDKAFVVIPHHIVMENVQNEQFDKTVIKKVTVADISGEGDDETVIYSSENTTITKQEIYTHRSLMDTCGRIQAQAKENGSNLIAVDRIGEGDGVYSRLSEIYADDDSMTIYGFDGRVKPLNEIIYHNHRAEAWFHAARLFEEKRCDIPNDPILIGQLSGVTWHYKSNEKRCIDPKDKLKKALRHSPDRADTYVMLLDTLDRAVPVEKKDKYRSHESRKTKYVWNSETC